MSTLVLDRPPIAGDPFLLHAFARRGRPLSTGDVLGAMTGTGASLSDVVEGLARARTGGLIGPIGFRGGRLLLALTDEGREIVAADRSAA